MSGSKHKKIIEFPFMDPDLNIEARLDDLIKRMTLEEKVSQLIYEAPAIPRLKIPEYNWWNECLHGVGRAGLATVFPQAIGMAAMFDEDHMFKIAVAISDEARAKHHEAIRRGKRGIYQGLTFWTPNINIFRDPRWGRGMETYGEDPYLTGQLAIAFIKGLQGDDPKYLKLVATAKHFVVHSGPESERHSFDARISAGDLNNTYLPHFEKCIKESGVRSVMCAYNRLDGKPCCGSPELLKDLLRDKWGFDGYVVSDCWALVDFYKGHLVSEGPVDAAALALLSGTDLNCGCVYPNLIEAHQKGLVKESDIDLALRRLFRERFRLGMFDPDERVPFSKISFSVVDSAEHKALALETARKSMVLLKNINVLPLDKNIKSIAIIGPNADDEEVLLANYNGHPSFTITPLQGILAKVGKNTQVNYARGCDLAENLPFMIPVPADVLYVDKTRTKPGLKADFYNNTDFEGSPVYSTVHSDVNFNWWEKSPAPGVNDDNFGICWTGVIVPPVTGTYFIGGDGTNGYKVYLDGQLIAEFYNRDLNMKRYSKVSMEAGRSYEIKIEYINKERIALMRFIWQFPHPDLKTEAIEAVAKSEIAIMFMGLSPRLEGEEMDVDVQGFAGGDRLSLSLPATQIDLMKAVCRVGKPVVLVLMNGSALSICWENENMSAILEAWYPGQAGGAAIADILFGDYNPSGKLPVTFYKTIDDLPAFNNYDMEGRTYRYFRKEPLYEFGYGLSYTNFHFKNIRVNKNILNEGENVTISIDVENAGNHPGEEVVQIYLTYPEEIENRPVKDLKGFRRVFLKPSERKQINIELNTSDFALYNDKAEKILYKGKYEILAGSSSDNTRTPDTFITIK